MAHATLTRVLKDIRSLDSEELRMVKNIVDKQLTPTRSKDPDEDILEAMLHAGLISEIKHPGHSPKSDRSPVPILGKPLSVTIIEERR